MRALALTLSALLVACGSSNTGSCTNAPPGSPCDSAADGAAPFDIASDGPQDVGPLPCNGLCGLGTACDGTRCVPNDAGQSDAATDASVADVPDASPGDVTDVTDVPAACVDRDGDGYGDGCARGPDCDDTDAQRHPGAVERCNGVDDDCDGTGDVARSDALDAWCTNLWRTAYARRNMDPIRDTSSCLIPPVMDRPGQLNCHPTRVACGAMAAHPSSGCFCFTSSDVDFTCP